MLEQLFDIGGYIVVAMIPAYLCYIILRLVYDVIHNKVNVLKFCICLNLTVGIIVATVTVLSINIFQLATLIKEAEPETVFEPWIKSAMFTFTEFVWVMICLISMSFVWRNLYYKQIIPGKGSVKDRLTDIKNKFFEKRQ